MLRILRRDLSELVGSIELVDLYNKGQPSYISNSVRIGGKVRRNATYRRTNVLAYLVITIGRSCIFKDHGLY